MYFKVSGHVGAMWLKVNVNFKYSKFEFENP